MPVGKEWMKVEILFAILPITVLWLLGVLWVMDTFAHSATGLLMCSVVCAVSWLPIVGMWRLAVSFVRGGRARLHAVPAIWSLAAALGAGAGLLGIVSYLLWEAWKNVGSLSVPSTMGARQDWPFLFIPAALFLVPFAHLRWELAQAATEIADSAPERSASRPSFAGFRHASVLVGVTAVLIALVNWSVHAYDRHTLPPTLLNIRSLPDSAKVLSCGSEGLTDTFTACTLTIAPKDFPALLTGWKFVRDGENGSGGVIAGVEITFSPTEHYSASPPEFVHGGSVDVYSDATRSNVAISYYEE